MAQLAIQGHATRGNEVIALLEMLGGKNIPYGNLERNNPNEVYYIDKMGYINWSKQASGKATFTLENFLVRFPYKIGDRVKNVYGSFGKVYAMKWIDDEIQYRLDFGPHTSGWYGADELQPFEEKESMEEKKINQMSLANCDLDEIEIVLGDKFELKIKDGKYYAVRKQYPKTYEECCDVLIPDCVEFNVILNGYNSVLLEEFGKLLICRDAYWKLADNWKPDWNDSTPKYTIVVIENELVKCFALTQSYILAFPTEEMRDAFYENFKDLIKQCKELL